MVCPLPLSPSTTATKFSSSFPPTMARLRFFHIQFKWYSTGRRWCRLQQTTMWLQKVRLYLQQNKVCSMAVCSTAFSPLVTRCSQCPQYTYNRICLLSKPQSGHSRRKWRRKFCMLQTLFCCRYNLTFCNHIVVCCRRHHLLPVEYHLNWIWKCNSAIYLSINTKRFFNCNHLFWVI
jgi:hypothetical protein